ncbi:MAG: GlsB/YeaQ/YmgE family stress response membrane protein [Actinomycetota bacterium]
MGLFLLGLIVGAFGRLALPGPDPMSIWMTSLTGIGGSLLGGMVGNWLFGRPGGFMLSVLAATGLVYLVRRSRARA